MNNKKIYAPDCYFNIKKSYKISSPLSFETVKNATILMDTSFNDDSFINFYTKLHKTGYVLDDHNRYCLLSSNHRYPLQSRSDKYEVMRENPDLRHKKDIYLGCFIRHWGHFLLEGLSRWWFLLNEEQYQDYEICYTVYGQQKKYMTTLMDLFGFDNNRLHQVTRTTRYDELIIPEISTEISKFWTDEFKQTINRIKQSIKPIENDKIYLSRLRYHDGIIGERAIAKTFKHNGYKMIYPERLPVERQIAYISGANHIASISGTTAHNLIFAKETSFCSIMERYIFPNKAQYIVNDMIGFNISNIYASYSYLPTSAGLGPFLVGMTMYLEQYFKDNKMKYKVQKLKLTQQFLLSYKRLWLNIYKNMFSDLLIAECAGSISQSQLKALIKQLENELKDAPSKIIVDKKIKDTYLRAKPYKWFGKVKDGKKRIIYFCGIPIYEYYKK